MIRLEAGQREHLSADSLIGNPVDEVVAPLHRLAYVRQREQKSAQAFGVHAATLRYAWVSLPTSANGGQSHSTRRGTAFYPARATDARYARTRSSSNVWSSCCTPCRLTSPMINSHSCGSGCTAFFLSNCSSRSRPNSSSVSFGTSEIPSEIIRNRSRGE